MKRQIAVFGPGHPTRREYNLAAEVGRLLAENGVTVVCGGLYGVMEAVCMGAKEAGGTTIGILRDLLCLLPKVFHSLDHVFSGVTALLGYHWRVFVHVGSGIELSSHLTYSNL